MGQVVAANSQLADEFKLDSSSDWMETTDLPQQPSQGQTIKIVDDGFTELDTLEESDQEIDEGDEDGNEMEVEQDGNFSPWCLDLLCVLDIEVEAPSAKKVRFEPTEKKKVDQSDLRKVQKVQKQKMKRKNKFETKLSENFEKALGNL